MQHGRIQGRWYLYIFSLCHTHAYFAHFNTLQPRDTTIHKLHQNTVQLPTQCTYTPGLLKSYRNSAVKLKYVLKRVFFSLIILEIYPFCAHTLAPTVCHVWKHSWKGSISMVRRPAVALHLMSSNVTKP
jgi:hypothetical protein